MNIKDLKFTWNLPDIGYSVEEPVFSEKNEEIPYTIFDLVQEVFYVTSLKKIYTEYNGDVKRKKNLNIITIYSEKLFEEWKNILNINYISAFKEDTRLTIEDREKIFSHIEQIGDINVLNEPYRSRLIIFYLFHKKNILTKSGKIKGITRNCIYKKQTFISYLNKCLLKIEKEQSELFNYNKLTDIIDVAKKMNLSSINKNYSRKKGRCFAIMDIKSECPNNCSELVCFSGFDYSSFHLDNEIDKLMKSKRFANSIRVRLRANTRYYCNSNNYFTYVQSNSADSKKKFSCCERKLFSYIELCDYIKSYTLYVKFTPCNICKFAINDYKKKYIGNICVGLK